jgi:hypothetical protein
MKTILIALALAINAYPIVAQKVKEAEVPVAVKSAFKQQYPQASEVKWDKENSNYEASFDLNKIDHSVLVDRAGKILESEVEIEMNELPNGISEYVKTHYKGMTVKEAAKITDAGGVITYEAEVKGMDLLFARDGKFIKEVRD